MLEDLATEFAFRQWRGGSNAPPTTIVDTDHTDHTERGNGNPCDP